MDNFKNKLANELTKITEKLFNEVRLVDFQITETGFYCDYEMQQTLNPELFNTISEEMKKIDVDYIYELDSFSGVYENGIKKEKILQRIYVIAYETNEQFESYKKLLSESALRDHKTIGSRQKLFSSSDDIGQGLTLWHPKGAMVRYLLEQFSQAAHILNDYQWVYTPHIGKAELWKKSGHLDFYRDSMYSPIKIDDEEYYLKPMNCPFHINIYNSEPHSYKDLPIRYSEFGTVYRYELSGALNGLTRVRGFTQDDAHIICTEAQIEEEVVKALEFSLYILRSFGFENFNAYVSTKPNEKFIGNDDEWNTATEVLKNAVVSAGLQYKIDDGGGAFYGPKIDIKLKDSINREWQCSTIQFDFNLPARFEMNYIGSDGKKHVPYMVHRALFGSLERFTALLIEHYAGDFPFWFTPVQLGIIPIKASHNEYCNKLVKSLKNAGFRVKLNNEDINMRNKIKSFELEKIPYILIVGDKEIQSDSFTVRGKKEGDLGLMNIEKLKDYLKKDIEMGKPRCL